MSKQAEEYLDKALDEQDELNWSEAVARVQEVCDVKKNTAETYIRRAATATTEVNADGDKVVVDPANAGGSVLSEGGELEAPVGGPTAQYFGNLPVLEDTGHPLVPDLDGGYFRRKMNGKSDVDVVTAAMNEDDFSTLLIGEAGVGKDRLVLHICAETNRPVIRPTFTGDGDLVDLLIGSYAPATDGSFEFKKGLLTTAVEKGYVFVGDEINMLSGRIQTQMNDILEAADQAQLIIPETNEVIEPHDEFMFVGTMNPPKAGYGGTQELNQAFQSRFIPVEVPKLGIDAEKRVVAQNTHWHEDDRELDILIGNGGVAPGVRSLYETGSVTTWISTRHIIQVGRMADALDDVRAAAEQVFTGHARPEDEDAIRSAIEDQNWP